MLVALLELGLEPIVVVLLLLLEPEAGVEAVVVLLVVLELLLEPLAGLLPGLTTVVLFSVFLSGEAGVAVSVFCSHETRSAALARIRMYFFIVFGCRAHNGVKPESEQV